VQVVQPVIEMAIPEVITGIVSIPGTELATADEPIRPPMPPMPPTEDAVDGGSHGLVR
jgi:hypothetical protein